MFLLQFVSFLHLEIKKKYIFLANDLYLNFDFSQAAMSINALVTSYTI